MRKLSNWLLATWISICSVMQLWPESLLYVWGMMPDDLKSQLPPYVAKAASFSVMLIAMLGKMHSMRRAVRGDNDGRK